MRLQVCCGCNGPHLKLVSIEVALGGIVSVFWEEVSCIQQPKGQPSLLYVATWQIVAVE